MRTAVRAAALAAMLAAPAGAMAQLCDDPMSYLQYCCFGCLVWDPIKTSENVAELGADLKAAAAFAKEAKSTAAQLQNDVSILERIGSSTPSIAQIMHVFGYGQGMQYALPATASGTVGAYQALYMHDQSPGRLGPSAPSAFGGMEADVVGNMATGASYSSQVIRSAATDSADVLALAQAVTASVTKRSDIKVNSRIREKLVDLEQTALMLESKVLGARARPVAYQNQTDLGAPAP